MRIGDGHDSHDAARQIFRCFVEHLPGVFVACVGAFKDHRNAGLQARKMRVTFNDPDRSRNALERARALGFWLERIGPERQETQFARGIGGAAHRLAVDQQPAAQTGSHGDVGEIVYVLPHALPVLADHRQVDVVFEDDIDAEGLLQRSGHVHPVETCKIGCHQHPAGIVVGRAGHADDRQSNAVTRDPRPIGNPPAQGDDLFDHGAPALRIGRFDLFGQHLAGQIKDGHTQLGAAEVNRSQECGVGDKFVVHRCPADMTAAPSGFLHPAFLFQLPDDLRNRLFRQTRLLGNGCPRDRAALDDCLHDGAFGKLSRDFGGIAHQRSP